MRPFYVVFLVAALSFSAAADTTPWPAHRPADMVISYLQSHGLGSPSDSGQFEGDVACSAHVSGQSSRVYLFRPPAAEIDGLYQTLARARFDTLPAASDNVELNGSEMIVARKKGTYRVAEAGHPLTGDNGRRFAACLASIRGYLAQGEKLATQTLTITVGASLSGHAVQFETGTLALVGTTRVPPAGQTWSCQVAPGSYSFKITADSLTSTVTVHGGQVLDVELGKGALHVRTSP